MTPPTIQWSTLQQDIFSWYDENERKFPLSWTRESLVVNAVAGSGKTTTLLELIRRIIVKGNSVAYTMFNKATVEEMKEKALSQGITSKSLTISTAHSFGLNAIKSKFGFKIKIEGGKCRDIYRRLYRSKQDFVEEKTTLGLVEQAKNAGVGIEWPTGGGKDELGGKDHDSVSPDQALWNIINHHNIECEDGVLDDCVRKALRVLDLSNEDRTCVDFGDMVYWPVLFSIKCEQFDYVLVDEAQDTNTMRRALFRSMLKPGGSLVAVGDRHQAIYGFTGADHDSLDIFVNEFKAKELPLDVCYRCAPHIVTYAQKWVKEIKPRKSTVDAENEVEDLVERLSHGDERSEPTVSPKQIRRLAYKDMIKHIERESTTDPDVQPTNPLGIGPGDAFLCRNNAPLIRTCFALLRRSIPCRIEGRDIGIQLIKVVESLHASTLIDMQARLDNYCDNEVAKALRKEDNYLAEIIRDKCEAISLFIEIGIKHGETPDDVVDRIKELFTDATDKNTPRDLVVLSSIHKAKGREWKRVFLLGREQYMPSRYATQPWQVKQEMNLIYVAVTRAMEELYEITNMP